MAIAIRCHGCGESLVVAGDEVQDGTLIIRAFPCLTCLKRYPTAERLEDALTGTMRRIAVAAMEPRQN